jgi:hypothetical protein
MSGDPEESGIGESRVFEDRELVQLKPRYVISRSSQECGDHRHQRKDRCWKVNPHRESTPSGIRDRESGIREGSGS